MKGFVRNDPWLPLCGLNRSLCPMHIGGHCGGCGFGNQSCSIARCALEHGGVAYCNQCGEYPCERWTYIDEYDSFMTHRNQRADLEKARRIGPAAYGAEQAEKAALPLPERAARMAAALEALAGAQGLSLKLRKKPVRS